ncbi:hypothetical protein YenMTG1_131 [Yersinia phage vB_YenM_TG1]|uniref:Uncharacterized protein n=1 Tax=Yersinia phage vB_YenM_TG1 TaxID=1589265 RepID=A0A0B5A4H5_9CAUD|nr:hypothetical protein AVV33_gp131 [Yersinia phage vB_YenM_TG1]AJD81941.1 hypothetical protein YenMTG1_131 [Yersinia phage vB_YenM_TG1]
MSVLLEISIRNAVTALENLIDIAIEEGAEPTLHISHSGYISDIFSVHEYGANQGSIKITPQVWASSSSDC